MVQTPAGWYELPSASSEHWTGSHWVADPAVSLLTGDRRDVDPAPAAAGRLAARLGSMSGFAVVGLAVGVGVPASCASVLAARGVQLAFVPASEMVTVVRVVDGDTVDVTTGDEPLRVRLLNVDAPERLEQGGAVQCLASEATTALTRLLPVGSTVTLEYDTARRDQYGRILAGVTNADGVLVNTEIARRGLGFPVIVGDSRRYERAVAAASREAQRATVGLFSPDTSCAAAAQADEVESRMRDLESVAAPTTATQAERLAQRAADVAALATALADSLRAEDSFEVVVLPAEARERYGAVASSALSRASAIRSSALALAAELRTQAQQQATADAARAEEVAGGAPTQAAAEAADAKAQVRAAEEQAGTEAQGSSPATPQGTVTSQTEAEKEAAEKKAAEKRAAAAEKAAENKGTAKPDRGSTPPATGQPAAPGRPTTPNPRSTADADADATLTAPSG